MCSSPISGTHSQIAVEAINGGRMDRFDLVTNGETLNGYTSFTRKGIPAYWAYADNFVLSDHTFSSMYGPTFPEHLYTVAAYAGDVVRNKDPLGGEGGYCGDPQGLVPRFEQNLTRRERGEIPEAEGTAHQPGQEFDFSNIVKYWERVRACFDFEVIMDQFEEKGISWRYYAADGSWMNALLAIEHIFENPKLWGPKVQRPFLHRRRRRRSRPRDRAHRTGKAQAGDVDRPSARHQRASGWPERLRRRELDGATCQRHMNSKYWKSTAIFITWDDFGGFYDHVPPPQYDIMGPRTARADADHLAVGQAGLRRQDRVRVLFGLDVHRDDVRSRLHGGSRLRRQQHARRVRLRDKTRFRGAQANPARARLFRSPPTH
jgi:hypothetical protein